MHEFIEIARFSYQWEYAVLHNLLEQKQLRFVFENENILAISPFYSYAIGGIRLKVHPDDAQEAQQVMEGMKKDDFSPLSVIWKNHSNDE